MEPKQILTCPKGRFQRSIQICVTTQEAVLSKLATSHLDSTTNSVETRVCVSVLVPSGYDVNPQIKIKEQVRLTESKATGRANKKRDEARMLRAAAR